MVYLLIGEDNFLIEEKLEELNINNKVTLSFKDKDFKNIFKQYINQRLFSENFVLVIKDLDKIEIPEDFLLNFRNKDVVLIFKQKPETLIKKLKDLGLQYQVEEIPSLTFKKPEEFEEFLLNYVKKYNIQIPEGILKSLSKIFLNSPTALLNDLKKIRYYKQGQKLTKEEIIQLIKWPTDSQIFLMLDSLISKNYSDFIMRLKREILIGTKIESIIGFLYKTLLRILLIKKAKPYQYKLLQKLEIKPSYQWRLKEYGKQLSESEIKNLIQILADLDRRYKKFILKDEDFVYEFLKNLRL